MKSIFLCLLFLIPFSALADKSPAQQVAESHTTWIKLKQRCRGNYEYKVSFSSFNGFGNETTIVVKNNRVVERRYREFGAPPPPPRPGPPVKQQDLKWVEKGEELGRHRVGAPIKTLDELYQEARKISAAKLEPHQKRYVRFDDNGLLQSCFYIDTRIADDAPRTGVAIGAIKLGAGS